MLSPSIKSHDRYEFLPAVLEVLETPPLPFGRIIAVSIALFFSLAVLWACLGMIDVVAIAQGRSIPSGNVKIIQPLETGVVRAIHVEDGDRVATGDLLIELDPTESVANLDALHIDLQQARLEVAVAEARLQDDPAVAFYPPQEVELGLIETARHRLIEDHIRHAASLEAIERDIERLEAALRSSDIEQSQLRKVIPLIQDRLNAQTTLLKKGMTPKPVVQALQQELIEKQAALSAAVETYSEVSANIAANKARLKETVAAYRTEIYVQRQNAMRDVALLEQNIRKEQQRLSYLNLRAPVDGFVQQLSVHTIGAVVNTAEPLLVVVPEDTALEIEAFILNKDIGFVEAGQDVEIKFEAFPFTRYGTLTGKLISISNDAIINEELGPVYKAKIDLGSQQIRVDGRPINLSPGMNVTAEIKTGTRRIIDYFISPLLRYKDEAIHER